MGPDPNVQCDVGCLVISPTKTPYLRAAKRKGADQRPVLSYLCALIKGASLPHSCCTRTSRPQAAR